MARDWRCSCSWPHSHHPHCSRYTCTSLSSSLYKMCSITWTHLSQQCHGVPSAILRVAKRLRQRRVLPTERAAARVRRGHLVKVQSIPRIGRIIGRLRDGRRWQKPVRTIGAFLGPSSPRAMVAGVLTVALLRDWLFNVSTAYHKRHRNWDAEKKSLTKGPTFCLCV